MIRALLLGLTMVGCVSVAPYQREDLASEGMEAGHEGAEMEFRSHVHDSREGATGGHSSTGGGCGCN
ncbi:MAG: hypothetical protein ACI9KE_000261 [Polyangiales bacterium]|jgi:hypothetical protein